VENLIIPDCGHYPAEEAPEAMLAALTVFLAPYRDGRTAAHIPTPRGTGDQPRHGDGIAARAEALTSRITPQKTRV
jgi:hypothetical protein